MCSPIRFTCPGAGGMSDEVRETGRTAGDVRFADGNA